MLGLGFVVILTFGILWAPFCFFSGAGDDTTSGCLSSLGQASVKEEAGVEVTGTGHSQVLAARLSLMVVVVVVVLAVDSTRLPCSLCDVIKRNLSYANANAYYPYRIFFVFILPRWRQGCSRLAGGCLRIRWPTSGSALTSC